VVGSTTTAAATAARLAQQGRLACTPAMCARQYSSRSRSSGGCSFNVLVGAGSAGAAVPTMAAAVRTVTGMRSLLTAASSGVSAAGGRFAGFTVGAVQRRGVKTIKRRIRKPPTKNYKMKTKKAVSSRFKRLGGKNGGLKYWRAGRRHNSSSKTQKQHRQLRKAKYASGNLLRLLNRMLIRR